MIKGAVSSRQQGTASSHATPRSRRSSRAPTIPLLIIIADLTLSKAASPFSIRPSDTPGSFDVLVDGDTWFAAGRPASIREGGRTLSAGTPDLVLNSTLEEIGGADALGRYSKWSWIFASAATGARFETSVRVYHDAIAFEQRFPQGLNGTSANDIDKLITSFPSFAMPSEGAPRRGFLQYSKDMMGSHYRTGEWNAKASGVGSGIAGTGPLCVFSENLANSVVLSAFSNFMAASHYYDFRTTDPSAAATTTLSLGLMGGIESLPAGYSVEFLMVHSVRGPNENMVRWGDKLLGRYGKSRTGAWERDLTLQTLGYSTDNGGYYYYNTLGKGMTYEETMIAVSDYAKAAGIPYKWWLADSWWYYKGVGNGVKTWVARPDIFPHGMEYVWKRTGWPVQGHNRYWASDNTYAKQNGGAYGFLVDSESGFALPNSQRFWDDLLRNSSLWGLRVYEQDWMYDEFEKFPPLTRSATLARQWLTEMGKAADSNGMTIQYCMSHCRHILASVEIPSVTQARASGDYHPGTPYPHDQWHQLGTTGILAWAVGVAPSKDNYWSSTYQPGSLHYTDHPREPYRRLQAAVITLSKGPVAPSDAVNRSDVALILRSCMADGTLLQPSRPATKLDSFILAEALDTDKPTGEVWFAETELSSRRYGVLFSAQLTQPATIHPKELGYAPYAALVAIEANSTSRIIRIGGYGRNPSSLDIPKCGSYDFGVWNFAPVEANGWALLGEVTSKWVGVSASRFVSVASEASSTSLRVGVRGAEGEVVEVSFAPPEGSKPVDVKCRIPAQGHAIVMLPEATCA